MINHSVLTVSPDDTIIVSTDRILRPDQRETIEAYLRKKLGVERVAVLDAGLGVTVLKAVA